MGAMVGEPAGGAPLLGAPEVMKGRLWGRASLFMGAELGNLEGGSFTRDFKTWGRWMSLSTVAPLENLGRGGGPSTGNFEN